MTYETAGRTRVRWILFPIGMRKKIGAFIWLQPKQASRFVIYIIVVPVMLEMLQISSKNTVGKEGRKHTIPWYHHHHL